MSFLYNAIISLISYIALLPFLVFGAVWGIGYVRTGKRKKSLELAMDVTTFFLVLSVSALIDYVFAGTFGGFWLILLFLLLLGGFLGNLQNRVRGKINPRRLLKAVWRLAFLALSAAFILLSIAGLIKTFLSL